MFRLIAILLGGSSLFVHQVSADIVYEGKGDFSCGKAGQVNCRWAQYRIDKGETSSITLGCANGVSRIRGGGYYHIKPRFRTNSEDYRKAKRCFRILGQRPTEGSGNQAGWQWEFDNKGPKCIDIVVRFYTTCQN